MPLRQVFLIKQTKNRSLKMKLQQPAFGLGAVSPGFYIKPVKKYCIISSDGTSGQQN